MKKANEIVNRDKFNIPKDWRDPTIDVSVEDSINMTKPKRFPVTVARWAIGIALVGAFLWVSADDLEVAKADAEYYEEMVEAGYWPASGL